MNIDDPLVMDMSMNPNGYHQPYLPPTMMPPPPPHSVAGGPPHHNEQPGGGMPVGPPQQQQPPPAHPPQQQQQTQNQTTTANNATANNSNQTSETGQQNSTGYTTSSAEATATPRETRSKCSLKKKVHKKPDPKAPKQRRFSGYYVYMRERRDQLRSMYPEMPFYEILRQLAQEWINMDREIKQKYVDSAEADKQNYEREKSAYEKTQAYKSMNKGTKKNHAHSNQQSGKETGKEIPTFTEKFLDHNKARELEFRRLRKLVSECEGHNATLQKQVEQIQAEIERIEREMRQEKLQNEMLSQNLNRLRNVLASSFACLPLPGTHEPPNIYTIDKYMNEVKAIAMQEANSVHFVPFLNRVKDIISRLEL